MEELEAMLNGSDIDSTIQYLMTKSVKVPEWSELEKAYDVTKHPIYDKAVYPDKAHKDGSTIKVSRVPINLIKVTVKRMTGLLCGIPVKRVYKADNDKQKEVASVIERIFERSRINSVNIERLNMLFAGCEVGTVWYAVEEPNTIYGVESKYKLRCRNFSPMNGDKLYPLFDDYGDMIAMSFWYERAKGSDKATYLDVYTKDRHIRYINDGSWREDLAEPISLGKIPCVYMYRPTPIWENNADIVYEMEWTLSRNGNYIRRNSKPILALFANEDIPFGNSDDKESSDRDVVHYPSGSDMKYVTWPQAVDNLKFNMTELRQEFHAGLQMPDFSMDNMKTTPMSGEARKMVFIDAQMKATEESGRIVEFLDREMNVVKALAKNIFPPAYHADIDALQTETIITPYQIQDETETIGNLLAANGNEPIISQREAIEMLGWSADPDKTMQEIAEQGVNDVFSPTE